MGSLREPTLRGRRVVVGHLGGLGSLPETVARALQARGSSVLGLDDPDGGLTSSDLAGSERVQGAHVDIGAFESEILYRNGFD